MNENFVCASKYLSEKLGCNTIATLTEDFMGHVHYILRKVL